MLQRRNSHSRKIIRPESATKPKIGFDGKSTTVRAKPEPPSANVSDLSAQIAKSKKFQALKKLKEEKERKKEMVVRDLKKVNVI